MRRPSVGTPHHCHQIGVGVTGLGQGTVGPLQAADGRGLPTQSNLNFSGPNQFTGGVLQTSGTFARSINTNPNPSAGGTTQVAGGVQWTGSGGFGERIVTGLPDGQMMRLTGGRFELVNSLGSEPQDDPGATYGAAFASVFDPTVNSSESFGVYRYLIVYWNPGLQVIHTPKVAQIRRRSNDSTVYRGARSLRCAR